MDDPAVELDLLPVGDEVVDSVGELHLLFLSCVRTLPSRPGALRAPTPRGTACGSRNDSYSLVQSTEGLFHAFICALLFQRTALYHKNYYGFLASDVEL